MRSPVRLYRFTNLIILDLSFPLNSSMGNYTGSSYREVVQYTIVNISGEQIGFFSVAPSFQSLTRNWPVNVTQLSVLDAVSSAVDALTQLGNFSITMVFGLN